MVHTLYFDIPLHKITFWQLHKYDDKAIKKILPQLYWNTSTCWKELFQHFNWDRTSPIHTIPLCSYRNILRHVSYKYMSRLLATPSFLQDLGSWRNGMLCHTQSWIIPGRPEMACSGSHLQVSEATNQVVYRVYSETIHNFRQIATPRIRIKS